MTEKEAKTKWCPFARVATDCGPSFNRWTRGEATGEASPSLCVASECMAWRWSESALQTDTMFWNRGDPEKKPEGAGWEPTEGPRLLAGRTFSRSWRRPHPARPGYCGLAGAPLP